MGYWKLSKKKAHLKSRLLYSSKKKLKIKKWANHRLMKLKIKT
jgi:hypothetical protein